ncbi:MAG: preprotein translocase subunit YajC [Rhodospirillales bacterium]|nr:preprotein translocase subunit YajC [Rhodospirillales bacterium]
MFISPAYAQGLGGDGSFTTLIPLVLIFAVFYFLLIRPQQKRAKMHRDMLGAMRRGDKIVMGGGIIGRVTKVRDNDELDVEIAEGVKVRVQRGMVASVLSKPDPAAPGGEQQQPTPGLGGLLGKFFGGGR